MLPPPTLTTDTIRQIEDEILLVCRHCRTPEELEEAGIPIWDWACTVLQKPLDSLRVDIESHETDEQFPNKYLEEKDHLLKIPLLLLDKLHHPAV